MNFNFDEFLERLKGAPEFVKNNVMCYYYHNTSACHDCPKQDECKAREPRDLPLTEEFDPNGRAHYLVRLSDYYCFAVPNPETFYGLFCNVISRLGRGEYVELFTELQKEELEGKTPQNIRDTSWGLPK